ncbi:MAG: tetratricopeptide repeat protein [Chitinophagaceae bacterium]|nr:MAG: tetratricopeptide repeat protein [Chitinophagaceae bacterium]
MKKTVSLMFTAMLAAQCLMAQIPAGIKFLNYEKNKSAKEAFQKAYDANPKDPQAIYWLGQAMLATDGGDPTPEQIQATKALYQKGLQEVGSDAWLLVGMGHIGILEKEDINAVKQKFEQAITATTETKGKNKGKPNPAILNAIGRANAEVSSDKGDHSYAIEKLKQAAAIDLTDPDILINMGINYLKLGGENGGDAVKAYQEALTRDPKNARAFFRIGKIYQSQNNKELFEQNFNSAIEADPAFPPVYFTYYDYYATRDVNRAKEYLDKYIANADKDPVLDLVMADYLFRSGKNAESLAKVKELEAAVGSKVLPKLDVLYALNFDRTGDSVQAKEALTKYFANAPVQKIAPGDYELAVKVFSKFPGSETQAVGYLERAMSVDTSKVNKLAYMSQAADLFGKAKMYDKQIDWLQKQASLKGGAMSEFDYYKLTSTAFTAKNYPLTIELSKKYMTDYPGKPQPYRFFKLAAIASDPDTTGVAAKHLMYLDSIYATIDKEKYKIDIFRNLYYILFSTTKEMVSLKNDPDFKITSDGKKTAKVDEYLVVAQKVVGILDQMMALYPDPADDNNKYAAPIKADIMKRIEYYSNPPVQGKKGSGGAATAGKG